MNMMYKMWIFAGIIDLVSTLFIYFVTVDMGLIVLTSIIPTILFLALFVPIQRIINQINRTLDKQGGKCYNCNLQIINKDEAILEDNNHVYCHDCDFILFGHTYYQKNGIWYRK